MENHQTKKTFSFAKAGEWYEKNERILEPLVFFGGFIFDNLTLRRIDQALDIFILGLWLCTAIVGIVLINISRHKIFKGEFFEGLESWAPIILQFAFGALFSGITIFYMRSATISTSWPFLAIVLFLFIGNEFFRKRYVRLNFQIIILFITLFFLSIFFVPIALGRMGAWVFLVSGALSVALTGALVHFLFAVLPPSAREKQYALLESIGGIFLFINILYFANIIPPIPLVLKDAGVYHFAARTEQGTYVIKDEYHPWYDFFRAYDPIHVEPGASLYFYSAVFAPTRLTTSIIHSWQYYDPVSKKWVESAKILFPIFGGADGGYRGYSEKTFLSSGKWRVDVTTERGQVLGRTKFEVVYTDAAVPLIQITK